MPPRAGSGDHYCRNQNQHPPAHPPLSRPPSAQNSHFGDYREPADRGASGGFRIVHVLDDKRRIGELARRDGTHDIGQREVLDARRQIERADVPVVARLGIGGVGRALEPGIARRRSAPRRDRALDFEPGRQQIDRRACARREPGPRGCRLMTTTNSSVCRTFDRSAGVPSAGYTRRGTRCSRCSPPADRPSERR